MGVRGYVPRFVELAACVPLLLTLALQLAAAQETEDAYLRDGRLLRGHKKSEAALDAFLRGVASFPDSPRLQFEAGRAFEDLGKTESAASRYETALQLRPDMTPALISLGVLRSEGGRLDEAAQLLKKAALLEPSSLAARHNLAIVLGRQGDLEGALSEYRRAAEIDPREAKVRHGMGSVLERLGRLEEAVKELEAALSIDRDFAPACYRLSVVCFRLGRKEDGERHLGRFRELKAREHLLRAEALIKEKDIRGAIRECERALDAQASFVEAHARLGALRLRDGDPERALVHARRAVELDPKPVRFANLSWTLHQNGKRDEALEWIEKALAVEPDRRELQDQRRTILESKPGGPSKP